MHIWNQLTLSKEQQRGYFKMIGNTTQLTYITDPAFAAVSGPCAAAGGPSQVCAPRNALPETTLYIPLLFWFCRNPGLALPLIALKSVGQKSIQPKISEHCFGKNLLWSQGDENRQTQMLVACC
jgi:Major capsid protein N-terminus